MGTLKLNKNLIKETEAVKAAEEVENTEITEVAPRENDGAEIIRFAHSDGGFIGEIESLRGPNQIVYRRNDGTCRKVISGTPQFYSDGEGNLKEIRSALTDTGSSIENQANSFKLKFSKDGSDSKIFDLQKGGKVLTLSAAKPAKAKAHACGCTCELCNDGDNKVKATLDDGTEIEYVSLNDRVKENIIIRERQESYEYGFTLNIGELEVSEGTNNDLLLKDRQTGETEFRIPAPYMFDANNKRSDKVSYEVDVNGSELAIKVVADAEFINAEGRAFPVTIDPQIVADSQAINLKLYTEYPVYDEEQGWTESDESTFRVSVSYYAADHYEDGRVEYKIPQSYVDGTITNIVIRLQCIDCNGTVSINGKTCTPQKGEYIDVECGAKLNNEFYLYAERTSVMSAMFDLVSITINYVENAVVKPQIKDFDLCGGAKELLNLISGEPTTVVPLIYVGDFNVPLKIFQSYKRGADVGYCGLSWRLNLNKKLIIADDDLESNTKYCFKDEYGNVKSFNELYYYNYGDTKVFIDKNSVTINNDGSLTCGNYTVHTYQHCDGYILIPEIDDYINANSIEQRRDEQIQLENYVKQLEITLKSYQRVSVHNGYGSYLGDLSSNSYEAEIEYIISKKGSYALMSDDKASQLRTAFLNKTSIEDQIVKIEKEITKKTKEKEQAFTYMNDEHVTEENRKYYAEKYNSLVDEIYSLNDLLSYTKDQQTSITMQIELILKQADRELPLVKETYKKYFTKKAELERLLRQTPVNYLRDENGIISGYNKNGDLVLMADSYGNYANIEYNVKNQIKSITDNNNKAIRFDYDNVLLQSITDTLGRQVKYEYDKNNQLIKLTYPDGETLTFEYSSQCIRSVKTSNGLQSKISIDDLKRVTAVSQNSLPVTVGDTVSCEKNEYSKKLGVSEIEYGVNENFVKFTKISNKENGYELYTFYDDGRIKTSEQSDSSFVKTVKTFTYDAGGNVIKTVTQNDISETEEEISAYDELNRLISKESGWVKLSDAVKIKTLISYTYDVNGNLIKEVTTEQTDVSGKVTPKIGIKNYSYNANGSLTLTESYIEDEKQTSGINYEQRVYNDDGNMVKCIRWNSLDSSSKFYEECDRAENGQLKADRGETGEISAEYEYKDGTNVVNSVKYPNGSKFAYGRNPYNNQVTSITQSTADGEANTTDVKHNYGLPVKVQSGNTTLGYTYDYKRRKTAVAVNGVTQVTYTYKDYTYNTNQNKCTFGEQTTVLNEGSGTTTTVLQSKTGVLDTVSGRIKATEVTKINGSEKYRKEYDQNGRLTSVKDGVSGTKTYAYDNHDNVTSISGGGLAEAYAYNDYGEVTQKAITIGAATQTYTYAYKNNAARELESISVEGYTFKPLSDVNGRNTGREIYSGENKVAAEYITYRKVGDHATNMPATVWFGSGEKVTDSIKYKYDSCGNICEIRENGHIVAKYTYDSLNRLVREDNKLAGSTTVITYDRNGNITERCEYPYTLKSGEELEELNCTHYSYDYEGDKLKEYNGEAFVYNNLGCPTTYRGKPATWIYGKLLASYNGVQFTYNGLGSRASKGGITFTYDSDGRLIKQSNGLEFIYDNSGVAGVMYANETYFYRKDAQGNIVALINKNGAVVVKYVYDAWGNNIALNANGAEITSGIGALNPFRYRGYYYDTETELYYLQTRYYDPELGRFISQDSLEYADPETINGLNLYAYCGNNPVMNIDPTGTILISILVGLIVGAAIGAAVGGYIAGKKAYENGARGWELFGWTLLGAVGGGIVGGAVGAFVGWAAPAIGSFLGSSFTLGSFALASGEVVTVSITGGQAVAGALGLLIWFSKSRPGNNQAQNRQFDAAMKTNGIKRTDPVWREIHDALHDEPPMNYKQLLKFIKDFLGR